MGGNISSASFNLSFNKPGSADSSRPIYGNDGQFITLSEFINANTSNIKDISLEISMLVL